MAKRQVYHTNIWEEEAEDDNPFATKAAYCHGYDVYGDVIKKATWFEYLYLLFKGEKPSAQQAKLLEVLAIALANPGPREASVRAAMNGGVGGARSAASLMSALSVGAGQYGGGRELFVLMESWKKNGVDVEKWRKFLSEPNDGYTSDIWLPFEHSPGFDPHGVSFPGVLKDILFHLEDVVNSAHIEWVSNNRNLLERFVGYPMSLTFIASAAFSDLKINSNEAVMLFHIFRLPGAAAHAIEQRRLGWKSFPYYGDAVELTDDPGFQGFPDIEEFDL